MAKYILSTMTSGVNYAVYGESVEGGLPVIRKSILINGGKGLPSLTGGFGEMSKDDQGHPMWTPDGVVTAVSEENYELLKVHPLFMKHLDGGYLKVINHDILGNHKAVQREVRGMVESDNSSQLTPSNAKQRVAGMVPKTTVGNEESEGSPIRIKG